YTQEDATMYDPDLRAKLKAMTADRDKWKQAALAARTPTTNTKLEELTHDLKLAEANYARARKERDRALEGRRRDRDLERENQALRQQLDTKEALNRAYQVKTRDLTIDLEMTRNRVLMKEAR